MKKTILAGLAALSTLAFSSCALSPEAQATRAAAATDEKVLEVFYHGNPRNTGFTGAGFAASEAEIVKRGLVRPSMLDICRRGSVVIGMTENEARAAWGSPTRTNTTTTAYGTREQWVYRTPRGYSASYLYLENGRVDAIQN